MNIPTLVVTILTLWLVMGLGFLSEYVTLRRKGKSQFEAWTSYEGLLFILSIIISMVILINKAISG